jgi:ribose transport system substrate-binding protein
MNREVSMKAARLFSGFVVMVLLILAILSGCGREQSGKLRILVSPKGLVHNFWMSVKAGADSAGKTLDVEIIWKGPAMETDIPGQISILEDYINKRVDAIVIAATDSRALIPTLEEASNRGIKVITIDSGVDSDIPLSFVASDNIKAANIAADVLVELIGGRGQVACIPFIPGAETSIWRETGFKQGLENYPDVDLVAVQYSQADVATAMAVTENILTAWPELDGIFAANESGAIGAAQALIARNLQGKVKLVVFDAAPNEIDALKSGVIQALIVQQPFEMGYQGVKVAVDAINGKQVDKRIDTGIKVVTLDNIDEPEILKTLNPTGN